MSPYKWQRLLSSRPQVPKCVIHKPNHGRESQLIWKLVCLELSLAIEVAEHIFMEHQVINGVDQGIAFLLLLLRPLVPIATPANCRGEACPLFAPATTRSHRTSRRTWERHHLTSSQTCVRRPPWTTSQRERIR